MLLYDGMLPAGSVVQSKASIELLPASKEAKVPLSAPTVPGNTASSSVQKKSDKPLALKIFEKACLGGESNSCSVLAAEYLKPGMFICLLHLASQTLVVMHRTIPISNAYPVEFFPFLFRNR